MSVDRNNATSVAYGYLRAAEKLKEEQRREADAHQAQQNARREMEDLGALLVRLSPGSQRTLFTFDERAVEVAAGSIEIVNVRNGANMLPKAQRAE